MNLDERERQIRLVVLVESKAHTSAQLAEMLGVPPDESWEVGSPLKIGTRQKVRESSSWAIVERAVGDEDCISAADRLVNRLQSLVPNFQALPPGVEVSLRILVDEDNGVFGVGLNRAQVQFAAAIGADIDVSVVVSN